MIIKTSPLSLGSKLGIIALSVPITNVSEETIQRAYNYLRNKGFKIIEASNCRQEVGHEAGTIQERVRTLHEFFINQEIDGILSFWGGSNTHKILEYLDYDLIRQNPKPLIGFSDTTSLQNAIFTKTGLVTFSGVAGITFGKPTVPAYTWNYFEKVLINPETYLKIEPSKEFSENLWYLEEKQKQKQKMDFTPNPGWKIFRQGKTEGRIIGSNLSTFLLLAGTEFWPDMRDKILFAEIAEENTIYTIDRMFTQLRHMGVYKQIKGLIIGRMFSNFGFSDQDSLEMILENSLAGYNFPVITNVDFGHTDPSITIPIGIKCSLDTTKPEIVFLESGCSNPK